MKFNPLTKVSEFRLKLYPKNFEKSKSFYKDLLGYPVYKEWDRGLNDKGIMFDVGNVTLELLSPEKEFVPLQGSGVSLEVKDVHKLWDNIKDKANIIFKIRNNEWGDTSFGISDPDGYQITFFTKLP